MAPLAACNSCQLCRAHCSRTSSVSVFDAGGRYLMTLAQWEAERAERQANKTMRRPSL